MGAQDHGAAPGLAASEPAHHHLDVLGPRGIAAAGAVAIAIREKAPDAANVEGPVDTEIDSVIFVQPANSGKQFATLRAQLALKGYGLSRTDSHDGPVHYHVGRRGVVRELRDLAAVRAFAEQVGASNA